MVWVVISVLFVLLVMLVVRANKRIIRIAEPRLGLLNLLGEPGAQLVQDDRSSLRAAFHDIVESEDTTPKCDVLFLYATVLPDGSLVGRMSSLRQMISESGAKIVFVANDNTAETYTAALKGDGGKANIVLTLDRKGWRFSHFIQQLFAKMEKGVSMPLAWVQLAPQNPNLEHEDCPGTLFLCEAGQITFKRPA